MKKILNYEEFKKTSILDSNMLDENQLNEIENVDEKLQAIFESGGIIAVESAINEGILGGLLGFAVGPSLGRIIAKALGLAEGGILYEMFTSRLVSAALGNAIQNSGKTK